MQKWFSQDHTFKLKAIWTFFKSLLRCIKNKNNTKHASYTHLVWFDLYIRHTTVCKRWWAGNVLWYVIDPGDPNIPALHFMTIQGIFLTNSAQTFCQLTTIIFLCCNLQSLQTRRIMTLTYIPQGVLGLRLNPHHVPLVSFSLLPWNVALIVQSRPGQLNNRWTSLFQRLAIHYHFAPTTSETRRQLWTQRLPHISFTVYPSHQLLWICWMGFRHTGATSGWSSQSRGSPC